MSIKLYFPRFLTVSFGLLFMMLLSTLNSHAQVTTAPLKDSLSGDTNGNMVANPGDTLTYKTTLTNEGANDALNVMFNLMLDPNTTLVPGSIKTTSLALNDTFDVDCAGLNIAAPGLLTNDFDDNIPGLSVVWNSSPSALGQMVSVNSDGSFMYPMTEDIMENDSFRYAITDVDGNTDTALVFLRINSVDNLIFVDNNNMSAGDGTSTNPYNSLALAEMNSNPGDTIFVFEGSGPYTGGITLKNNQVLIGEEEGLDSKCIDIAAGNAPTIENSSGDAIVLAQNNIIKGIKIGNANGFAIDDAGISVGNLTISNTEICNSTGGGFRTVNGGVLAVTLEAVSTNGGSNGIITNIMSGSFSVIGMTTIDNSTSTGFQTQNNAINFTFNNLAIDNSTSNGSGIIASGGGSLNVTSGMVNSGSAIPLDIEGMSTSGFTLSSVMSTTGSTQKGVELTNNTGTWSLGTVDVSRTLGVAFFASNAGTVNSTGGTIVTTTGRAVDIDNSVLGMTLTSVSSNGGSNPAIDLNTMTGSFEITGSGSTDESGGTIDNIFADAIILNNTTNVTLKNMRLGESTTMPGDAPDDNVAIQGDAIEVTSSSNLMIDNLKIADTSGDGIKGNGVNNLTLTNSEILNVGLGAGSDESAFDFGDQTMGTDVNLIGTVTITNTIFDGMQEFGIYIYNDSGNLTLNIDICRFSNQRTNNAESGMLIETDGTAMSTVTVTNSTGDKLEGGAFLFAQALDGTLNVTAQNNTVMDGGSVSNFNNTDGFNLATGDGTLNFDISNNTISGNRGHAVRLAANFGGTLNGQVVGNDIDGAGPLPAASAQPILVQIDGGGAGNPSGIILINNNDIDGIIDDIAELIDVEARDGVTSLDITITNNRLNQAMGVTGDGDHGIEIRARDNASVRATVSNNTVTSPDACINLDSEDNSSLAVVASANTLNSSGDDEFQASCEDPGSSFCLKLNGHTSGVFDLDEDAGTFTIEDLGTISGDNSGATIEVGAGITANGGACSTAASPTFP